MRLKVKESKIMKKSEFIRIVHAIGASACLFVICTYSKIDSAQIAAVNAIAGIGLMGNIMCVFEPNLFRTTASNEVSCKA